MSGNRTSQVTTGLEIGGATAVVTGLAFIFWPAAVAVAGAFAIVAGYLVGDGEA